VKFRRQAPIDNFIADFYCHKAKLVIELDGSQHETEQGMHNDALRTEKLEAYGLQVIRIPNRCIDKDFYRVCDYIDQTVKNILGDA
jgi:very-short-patch-repair endonuclease